MAWRILLGMTAVFIPLAQPAFQSYAISDEELLPRWTWFRAHVEEICGIQGLPEGFSRDEGEITVIEATSEEDEWMVPAEFNYDSRTQEIAFEAGAYTLHVKVHEATFGSFYTFELQHVEPERAVKMLAKRTEAYLQLDEAHPGLKRWRAAAAEERL